MVLLNCRCCRTWALRSRSIGPVWRPPLPPLWFHHILHRRLHRGRLRWRPCDDRNGECLAVASPESAIVKILSGSMTWLFPLE